MNISLVTEIVILAIALLLYLWLHDMIVKRQSVSESAKNRLSKLFTNPIIYRVISISLTALIFYLLYTLIFKEISFEIEKYGLQDWLQLG